MPKPLAPVSCAVQGGASHVATLAGGLYTLDERVDIVRVIGTSAGALAAVALAFGVDSLKALGAITELLADNRVLDFGTAGGHGLCRWGRLRHAIVRLVGEDATFADALIPCSVVVCDAYERRPVVFGTENTPKVKVHEAATASAALWPLADMQTIPSSGRGSRLFFDGGFARNLAADEWDGHPEPMVALRLNRTTVAVDPVRDIPHAAMAVLETMLWSADHAHLSSRADAVVVDLDAIGSGLDFDLTREQVLERWTCGRKGVLSAYSAGRLPKV